MNNPLSGTDPTGYDAMGMGGDDDDSVIGIGGADQTDESRLKNRFTPGVDAKSNGAQPGATAKGAEDKSKSESEILGTPLNSNLDNSTAGNLAIVCGPNGFDSMAPGPQMHGVEQNWADIANERQNNFMQAHLPDQTYKVWSAIAGPIDDAIVDASHGHYGNAALQGAMFALPGTKLGGQLVERIGAGLAADVADAVGPTVGDLRAEGLKDAHHIIQDAAVRDLPGYATNAAPGVTLRGPSNVSGTAHNLATAVQREAGGGTYAAERRIGYKALRAAGMSEDSARAAIGRADRYFGSIGVDSGTVTRIPGNR